MFRKGILSIILVVVMAVVTSVAAFAETPDEISDLYDILMSQMISNKYDFDQVADEVKFYATSDLVEALDEMNALEYCGDGGAYVRRQDVEASSLRTECFGYKLGYSFDGEAYVSIEYKDLYDFIKLSCEDFSQRIVREQLLTHTFYGAPVTLSVGASTENHVNQECDLTLEEIEKGLFGKLEGYGELLMELQDEYGVGLDYAVAVADLETKCGTAGYGKTHNNLFNIRHYSGEYKNYNGEEDPIAASLEDFFKLISNEYIDQSGDYYCGPDIYDIGAIYAESPIWAETVKECLYGFYSRAAVTEL